MPTEITAGPTIDLCIVATRRPDLLEQTLASFRRHLLARFHVGRVIANIDPAFGTLEDEAACVDLIRRCDADAVISLPQTPCFARAVASNWSLSTADIVLHLEDDWLLQREIGPGDIRPFFEDARIGQISFDHADKRWDRRRKGRYCYTRRRHEIFGMKFSFGRKIPVFLTAPSFFRGSFARGAARLMDPNFDPEKQFSRGVNPKLEAYAADFRNLILGEAGGYYIADLGRDWRRDRGIEKQVVAGQSYWTGGSAPPAT